LRCASPRLYGDPRPAVGDRYAAGRPGDDRGARRRGHRRGLGAARPAEGGRGDVDPRDADREAHSMIAVDALPAAGTAAYRSLVTRVPVPEEVRVQTQAL